MLKLVNLSTYINVYDVAGEFLGKLVFNVLVYSFLRVSKRLHTKAHLHSLSVDTVCNFESGNIMTNFPIKFSRKAKWSLHMLRERFVKWLEQILIFMPVLES